MDGIIYLASADVLTGIANAIRSKNGQNVRYKPTDMVAAAGALDGTATSEGAQHECPKTGYACISKSIYKDIANAARAQNGKSGVEYTPRGMAQAIRALEWKPADVAYAVAVLGRGECICGVAADTTTADGYVWAHYTAYSGATRYVAIGTEDGSEKHLTKV